MKKLEELGISPAPWRFLHRDEIGADVKCAWKGIAVKRRHTVVVLDAFIADARLIAAAPELYEALELIVSCWGESILNEDGGFCKKARRDIECGVCNCEKCPILLKAKAALAKAGGEYFK